VLTVLLGLAAGLGYGLADFVGGLASRRVHYAVVSVIGTATAVVITFLALIALPGTPTAQALTWGTIAGLGGGFGGLMLYRGLGRGRMGVVAPLSALGTAVIPVIVGVALGERPSVPAWAGIALALPAIWLVSTSGEPTPVASADSPSGDRAGLEPGVVEGLLAGLGFALLLIGLGLGGGGVGLWPVAASQVSALVVMGVAMLGALRRPENRNVPRRDAGLAVSAGLFGGVGAICYLLATQTGLLSIVAVITSLYPASTVLLSAVVLHERIHGRQLVGLALAVAAVVLIVLG
jgi:uncharacterized membrane protein